MALATERTSKRNNSSRQILTGNRCQCTGCGEFFNSATTFDGHRVGAYAPKNRPNTRRCLAVAEMQAKGWLLNGAGFWISETRSGRQQRRGHTRRSGDRLYPGVMPAPAVGAP
jgi:hypothetical protein